MAEPKKPGHHWSSSILNPFSSEQSLNKDIWNLKSVYPCWPDAKPLQSELALLVLYTSFLLPNPYSFPQTLVDEDELSHILLLCWPVVKTSIDCVWQQLARNLPYSVKKALSFYGLKKHGKENMLKNSSSLPLEHWRKK